MALGPSCISALLSQSMPCFKERYFSTFWKEILVFLSSEKIGEGKEGKKAYPFCFDLLLQTVTNWNSAAWPVLFRDAGCDLSSASLVLCCLRVSCFLCVLFIRGGKPTSQESEGSLLAASHGPVRLRDAVLYQSQQRHPSRFCHFWLKISVLGQMGTERANSCGLNRCYQNLSKSAPMNIGLSARVWTNMKRKMLLKEKKQKTAFSLLHFRKLISCWNLLFLSVWQDIFFHQFYSYVESFP